MATCLYQSGEVVFWQTTTCAYLFVDVVRTPVRRPFTPDERLQFRFANAAPRAWPRRHALRPFAFPAGTWHCTPISSVKVGAALDEIRVDFASKNRRVVTLDSGWPVAHQLCDFIGCAFLAK